MCGRWTSRQTYWIKNMAWLTRKIFSVVVVLNMRLYREDQISQRALPVRASCM